MSSLDERQPPEEVESTRGVVRKWQFMLVARGMNASLGACKSQFLCSKHTPLQSLWLGSYGKQKCSGLNSPLLVLHWREQKKRKKARKPCRPSGICRLLDSRSVQLVLGWKTARENRAMVLTSLPSSKCLFHKLAACFAVWIIIRGTKKQSERSKLVEKCSVEICGHSHACASQEVFFLCVFLLQFLALQNRAHHSKQSR